MDAAAFVPCEFSLAAIEEVYALNGKNTVLRGEKVKNTPFDGARVLPPIVLDGRDSSENFQVTHADNNRLLLAHASEEVFQGHIESSTYSNHRAWDTLVDVYKTVPPGQRGMLNLGYATKSMAGTGPYLQRFDPQAERGGIRVPTEKRLHPKVASRTFLDPLNGLMKVSEDFLTLVLEHGTSDWEGNSKWPTSKNARDAVVTSYEYLKKTPPPEPFPGLQHQFATFGKGESFFHFDGENAGMLCGNSCDVHLCMTHNPTTVLVVHLLDQDGNAQPYCIRQYKHSYTAFRGANSLHGSVNERTYLSLLNEHVGGHDKYTKGECDAYLYESESDTRVYFTTYSRHSLLDHAWELRLWTESGIDPYYVNAGSTRSRRPKQANDDVERVASMYGLVSPFARETAKHEAFY